MNTDLYKSTDMVDQAADAMIPPPPPLYFLPKRVSLDLTIPCDTHHYLLTRQLCC